MSPVCQYATFRVGGHCLAIPVLDVQEVLRGQRLTPVPLAPHAVTGLINLRGQIVPALEMRRLLDLPPRDGELDPLSVVVRTEHGAVSLQVDEIGDVLELDGSTFELPPQNVDPHLRSRLVGVHKLKGRLLLVLDIRRTVDLNA
ncbi:MAG: chemotaxis protein CheW [Candidatus Sulfopaludibacter sp.]|nr:chemotaxis protein CheW [Candidatus Sulfopaludibacter sp.]